VDRISKHSTSGNGQKTSANVSYAIFSVDAVKTFASSCLASQRVATLLAQLDRVKRNTSQVSVEFLTDTLNQCSSFKYLGRLRQLLFKDPPTAWTQAEKDWVDGPYARNDLLPFLPARGCVTRQ
jgi:hypothetical protein